MFSLQHRLPEIVFWRAGNRFLQPVCGTPEGDDHINVFISFYSTYVYCIWAIHKGLAFILLKRNKMYICKAVGRNIVFALGFRGHWLGDPHPANPSDTCRSKTQHTDCGVFIATLHLLLQVDKCFIFFLKKMLYRWLESSLVSHCWTAGELWLLCYISKE